MTWALGGELLSGMHGGLWSYKVRHSAASLSLPPAAELKLPLDLRFNVPFYRPYSEDFAVRSYIDDAAEDANVQITLWLETPKKQYEDVDTGIVYSPLNYLPAPVVDNTTFPATGGAPKMQTFEGTLISGNWFQVGGKIEGTWTSDIVLTVETWLGAFGLNIPDNPFFVDDFRGPEEGDIFSDLTLRS